MEQANCHRPSTPRLTARGSRRALVWRVVVCTVLSVTTWRCASNNTQGAANADASTLDSGLAETGTGTPPEAAPPEEEAAPPEVVPPEAAAMDAGAGVGASDAAEDGWTLIWSDEFNGPDGSDVDPSKWIHETGNNGGANSEQEYYTPGTANTAVGGGLLVITALQEPSDTMDQCWYGTCLYTSARINTSTKFTHQYGRFEASIQVPSAQGMWPAFWMLGSNIGDVGWPDCGEIDIVECIDKAPFAAGSLHAGGNPDFNATAQDTLPGMASFSEAFHTYAVEWAATGISFFVDGTMYETQTPADAMNAGGDWAFDAPFFIILNLAVGGGWPGNVDNTTTFPQVMKVDWVRVYSKN
jgi:beta-glucanase (GH16 family)